MRPVTGIRRAINVLPRRRQTTWARSCLAHIFHIRKIRPNLAKPAYEGGFTSSEYLPEYARPGFPVVCTRRTVPKLPAVAAAHQCHRAPICAPFYNPAPDCGSHQYLRLGADPGAALPRPSNGRIDS
jgi:hypothetical protein